MTISLLKSKNHPHTHLAQRLHALSRNLWWTWNPEAQHLFKELSPLVWRYSNHNATAVLREISGRELEARLRDHEFARRVRNVLEEFETYLSDTNTWSK